MRNILYAAAAAAALAFAPFTPSAGIATATPVCDPAHPAPGCASPVSPTKPVTAPTTGVQANCSLDAAIPCNCPPGETSYHQSCQATDTIPRTLPTREGEPGNHPPLTAGPAPATTTAAGPRCDPVHPTPGCAR
jgi:hypothetical protein